MEALNLHLTGDMHAVTAAHNLLSAMIGNHLHKGNKLGLDPHEITWRRVLDVNDRELRNIVTGLGRADDGTPRQTGFDISAASEVMALLSLCTSLRDLRDRMGRIVVGYTHDGEPVTAEMLKVAGAMTVMLKDAIKPNLMQTAEQTPVLVHCGPFGNIATGNSSVVADLIGIHAGDYLITEAGFGADIGAEKFFNIKCRASGLTPDAAVVVATVRDLKTHSGKYRVVAGRPLPPEMLAESPDDVLAGAANLRRQIANIRRHGVTPVVAINAFPTDHASEHRALLEVAAEEGVRATISYPLHAGRQRCGRTRRSGRRSLHRTVELPAPVRRRPPLGRQDRRDRARDVRGRRIGCLPSRRSATRQVRAGRVRQPAGVHREDPPLAVGQPEHQGSPDGMATAGA